HHQALAPGPQGAEEDDRGRGGAGVAARGRRPAPSLPGRPPGTAEVDAADAARLSGALLERLKAVAPAFDLTESERDALAARGVGPLLEELVRSARERASDPHVWLLIVAVTANFPNADQVRMTRRAVGFAD